ncbi:MAG: hypothetical protein ACOCY1_02875 [Halovenus sp.]
MSQSVADNLLRNRRTNAVIGWVLLLFLGIVAGESAINGDIAWGLFVSGIVALCILPPLAFRTPGTMLPWEVIAMAALPALGRAIAVFDITRSLNLYLSIAALALIVAVELELFTEVKMTVGFAIMFVVASTLAATAVWSVLQWSLDLLIGTQFLIEPGRTDRAIHDALMMEFVYTAISGLLAGIIFEFYFRRGSPAAGRIEEEGVDI